MFNYMGTSYKSSNISNKPLFFIPTDRNKDPIFNQLKLILTGNEKVLELGSGSGQHIKHFAINLPECKFQPSETIIELFYSIEIYSKELKNVLKPIILDITKKDHWDKVGEFDVIFLSNILHISEYKVTECTFKFGNSHIKKGGYLLIYGPFKMNGNFNSESNIMFDKSLKEKNLNYGLRDVIDLKKLGLENKLKLKDIHDMPANNYFLVFEKIE